MSFPRDYISRLSAWHRCTGTVCRPHEVAITDVTCSIALPFTFRVAPDCFAELVNGPRIRATRWLAMTKGKSVEDLYFVSGQPESLADGNALSPGTTASCL
jgi:hypothetical protein